MPQQLNASHHRAQGIGNIPADATDDQIRAALKRSNVPLPTATCCTTSNGFLSGVRHAQLPLTWTRTPCCISI